MLKTGCSYSHVSVATRSVAMSNGSKARPHSLGEPFRVSYKLLCDADKAHRESRSCLNCAIVDVAWLGATASKAVSDGCELLR